MKFWLYTALRFIIFGVAFFITLIFTDSLIFGLVVGLVAGFALTYLFTPKLRKAASDDLVRAMDSRKRNKTATNDADAEDSYTEGRFVETHDLDQDADGEQNGVEDPK